MISLTTILISLALGVIIFLIFKRNKKDGRLPPGPFPLPIVGNMLSFAKTPQKSLLNWGEAYGKMFTITFGGSRMVVLNDSALIREAFNDSNVSGRPDGDIFSIFADGPHGIIASAGQEWVDQRRFTLRHLRDFGFGKNVMEDLIMEEVNEFISTLKSNENQPISLARKFNLIVFNSLWRIISGQRHAHDDPKLSRLLDGFNEVKEESGPLLLVVMFFPRFAKLFPSLTGWNTLVKTLSAQREFVMKAVNEHEKNKPTDGVPNDFMDAYLKEIQATSDTNSSFYKQHGLKSMLAVVLDLFNAGNETTANTLTWAFLYVTKFPEIQKKIQAEFDEVVGRSRQVTLQDRPNLPYTEATILEVLRYSSIVPLGLVHTTMTAMDFHGYHFPKGTKVAANNYYSHFSSKLWNSPETFNPERFLSQDGKTVKRSENLIPFSVGKRQCLGESLARDSIFLFAANILQRFHVRLGDDSVNVTLDAKLGVSMEPHPHSVVFTERI